MSLLAPTADPLTARPAAERPAYATGMLLDARDFSDEQTYHRNRLARGLGAVTGGGTLAGLRIEHVAAGAEGPEQLTLHPGLAIDRLGRLIELPRPACLRLPAWWDAVFAGDGGDTLRRASYDDLGRFASARLRAGGDPLPARAVVADVFVRFAECPVGLTPSFAAGPFDALNAVSTARIRDAYELRLIPRDTLGDSYTGLPLPPAAAALGDSDATPAERRDAAQDAVLAAYPRPDAPPPAELPLALDPSAVFLGRVFVAVSGDTPPARADSSPVVDNWGRRFLPSLALFAQWAGV